jgi:hypothetical protein
LSLLARRPGGAGAVTLRESAVFGLLAPLAGPVSLVSLRSPKDAELAEEFVRAASSHPPLSLP